ncbi:TIGR01777 family oxidoreductase [Altibacter sp.]|uniref:TIGR01777 family oxidoreductase n=1 Tax=Altibacter sp. TaxID=2024823 RepID=UPI00258443C4|nr:TIGR01777 family oxidoreductase [Altibacter sp.]MCW8982052.1 TIGR01777 family oxidoreductase [Altibacter sp.]MCW9038667.1 TIGR01777 family oxidoreductase [Altibacter sp.]
MKILITGATGLIGSRLSEKCIEQGMTVHYLTTSKDKLENKERYIGFYWDPENNEIDTKAFQGVSAIINLVGGTVSKRWTKSYKKVIMESRTQTANLIFETLQQIPHDIKHFISASGVSIYPNSKTKLYTEESKEVDDTFLAEVVVAWEAAADQFKSLGMEVTKVRTGVVLSAEDGALPKIAAPVKYWLGAPLGSGNQWQSWIHIDDIVGIYYHILTNELEGVFNAVAPNPVTNKKLTKQIASKLQKPLWLPNVPGFIIRTMLGEMAVIVLKGQLVSSRKIEEHRYIFQYYNLENAIDDLL